MTHIVIIAPLCLHTYDFESKSSVFFVGKDVICVILTGKANREKLVTCLITYLQIAENHTESNEMSEFVENSAPP
ncbi:MAG: hypothetical protein MHMPM18_003064, partial [Marteilia pararefringens]